MARTTCVLPSNRTGITVRYHICDFISDLPSNRRKGDLALVGGAWYVSDIHEWLLVGEGSSVDTTVATGIVQQTNLSAAQIRRGQPVAGISGGVILASNADLTLPAIGIALEAINVGVSGRIATVGIVDLIDWTIPTGTANLTSGQQYYLGLDGTLVAGRPTTVVQQIGQAVSATAISLGLAPVRPAALGHLHVSENIILTITDINNKFILLGQVPLTGSVILAVQGAAFQRQGVAWVADADNPKKITWNGYSLDGLLEAGDNLVLSYQRLP